MILVNTDYISGKTLETLGLVYGVDVVFGTIRDRKIKSITKIMEDNAKKIGADAIINIRYSHTEDTAFVSGTAVRFA